MLSSYFVRDVEQIGIPPSYRYDEYIAEDRHISYPSIPRKNIIYISEEPWLVFVADEYPD